MQTDKDKRQSDPECQDDVPEPALMHRVRIAVLSSLVIVAVVAICGIIFGFISDGHFTLEYAFAANFIVAAVMVTTGLILPLAPNRVVDKLRNRQLVEYYMHSDFMSSRASKQKQGYKIMWVGLSSAVITGALELVIWLIL